MYYERTKYLNRITESLNKVPIVVLIGARQVGKTTLMKNVHLSGKKVFLNGQDIAIQEIFTKFSNVEAYLKIHLNPELNGYLLIDEFQFIDGISTTLKLLVDTYSDLKILCSGSSSLGIIQKVEESLAGRIRFINVYSLSLKESLKFSDEEIYQTYEKYQANTEDAIVAPGIKQMLSNYLIYGGMPRIALTQKEEEKIELLEDIYQTYLLKDIKSFIRNEDTVGFNRLLRLLAAQIGNMVNVNELSVKSGLSYKFCEEYLYLLEQMFIIKLVEPYYSNKRNVITKMKKVFFTDLGFRNIIYRDFNPIDTRVDNGALFENFVFLELIKIFPTFAKVYYYRTKDGSEIDFVIDDMRKITIFEVKYKNFTKPRNFKNITSFGQIVEYDKAYIVNENLNEVFNDLIFIQGYLIEKVR